MVIGQPIGSFNINPGTSLSNFTQVAPLSNTIINGPSMLYIGAGILLVIFIMERQKNY